MLTASGCQTRRERLRQAVGDQVAELVIGDPVHLRYLANFHVDPFSLGADFGGFIVIRPDGHTTLYHDRRLPSSVQQAHVDERVVIPWYDGITAGQGPRHTALLSSLKKHGGRIHDSLENPLCESVSEAICLARRQKDSDEIALLKQCMAAGKAGQDWARQNVRAGMTELDVYLGIFAECSRACKQAAILYGDFAVSPGMSRRGGPPTDRVLANGDMLILDFSVVHFGYRSDFTNTLVVGGSPNAQQKELFNACVKAMEAGEKSLKAGASCQSVYDAVYDVFGKIGMGDQFPHHAGHGLGLGHPEAPFFVKQSSETLLEGDVVTLEPGLYVDGVGGIRIEHNYLITKDGYERLSEHTISLV